MRRSPERELVMGISDAWLSGEFGADAQERLRQLLEHAEREPLPLTGDWPRARQHQQKVSGSGGEKLWVPVVSKRRPRRHQQRSAVAAVALGPGRHGARQRHRPEPDRAGQPLQRSSPNPSRRRYDHAGMAGRRCRYDGARRAGSGAWRGWPGLRRRQGREPALLWNQQRQRDNMLSKICGCTTSRSMSFTARRRSFPRSTPRS